MRKLLLLVSALVLVGVPAMAQGPGNPPADSATATLSVAANVVGMFEFEIPDGATVINFGEVDAGGYEDATPGVVDSTVTIDLNAGTATYSVTGVKTWAVRSAPIREVAIEFTSNDATGGMSAGQLKLQVPASLNTTTPTLVSGTSNGFLAAGSGQNLITGFLAGRGNLERTGTIDIELTVEASDVPGPQTFDLVLTANGT